MTPQQAVIVIKEMLLIREGEPITEELALERARNIVTAIDIEGTNNAIEALLGACRTSKEVCVAAIRESGECP